MVLFYGGIYFPVIVVYGLTNKTKSNSMDAFSIKVVSSVGYKNICKLFIISKASWGSLVFFIDRVLIF